MSSFEIHDRVRHIGTGKILLVIAKSAFIERSSRMRPIPACIPYDKEDLYSYVTEEKNEKWVGTALNSRLILISKLSERSPSKKVVVKRTHQDQPKLIINKGFEVGDRIIHTEISGCVYTVISESDYVKRMGRLPGGHGEIVLVQGSSGLATYFQDIKSLRRKEDGKQGPINMGYKPGDIIYHASYPTELYTVASEEGFKSMGGVIPRTTHPIVLLYKDNGKTSYFYVTDEIRKVEKKTEKKAEAKPASKPVPASINKGFTIGEVVATKHHPEDKFVVISEQDYQKEHGFLPYTENDVVLVRDSKGGTYYIGGIGNTIRLADEGSPIPIGTTVYLKGDYKNPLKVVSRKEYLKEIGALKPSSLAANTVFVKSTTMGTYTSGPESIFVILKPEQTKFTAGATVKGLNSGNLYQVVSRETYAKAEMGIHPQDGPEIVYIKNKSTGSYNWANPKDLVLAEQDKYPVGSMVTVWGSARTVINLEEYLKSGKPMPHWTVHEMVFFKSGNGEHNWEYVRHTFPTTPTPALEAAPPRRVFPIGSTVEHNSHPGKTYKVIDAKTFSDKCNRGTFKDDPEVAYLDGGGGFYTWDYVKYLKLVAQPVPTEEKPPVGQTKWAVGDMVSIGFDTCYEVTTREEWNKKQTSGIEPANKDVIYLRHSTGEVTWTTLNSISRKATTKEIALFLCPLDKQISIRGMLMKRTTYTDYVAAGGDKGRDDNTLYFRGAISDNGYAYGVDDLVQNVKRTAN